MRSKDKEKFAALPKITCSLPDFEDGSWALDRDVPIFYDPDQAGEYTLDDLETLVEKNNNREKSTCDLAPIVVGHTDPERMEHEQPPIIGYAKNYRLANFMERPTIIADLFIRKDKLKLYKDHPRRSPEIFDDGIIDPISVLGATSPRNDLALRFQKKTNNPTTYSNRRKMDTNNDLVAQVLEALKSSDVFKWCESKMQEEQAPVEEVAPVEDAEQFESNVLEDAEEQDDEATPMKRKFSEEDEAEDKGDKLKAKKCMSKDKIRLERDELARKYSRLESQNANMKERFAKLERQTRRAERERDLLRLREQGFEFEMNDELDTVTDQTPERFAKYLAHIKKNYRRLPNANHLIPAMEPEGERSVTQADVDKAIAIHTSGKMQYHDALKQIKAGQL